MITSFWMFVGCVVVLILASVMFPQPLTDEAKGLVWKSPLDALRQPGWKGLGDYRFLSILLLAILVLFYALLQNVK